MNAIERQFNDKVISMIESWLQPSHPALETNRAYWRCKLLHLKFKRQHGVDMIHSCVDCTDVCQTCRKCILSKNPPSMTDIHGNYEFKDTTKWYADGQLCNCVYR